MPPAPEKTPDSESETSLPVLRTWPAVYWFVLGIFVLWVSLLTWLTRHFA